jgi:hypothetical protein
MCGKPAGRRGRAAWAEGYAIEGPERVVAPGAPGAFPVLTSEQRMTRPQAFHYQSRDTRVSQPEYVEEGRHQRRQHWRRRFPRIAL